jgi:uncharacterized protein
MASITVCGTAHRSVAPDRARLDLGLTHVATTASAAMGEISRRSEQIAAMLATLGFASTDWSTQGVTVAEEWEWKNDANTRVGYRATAGVGVNVADFDRIAPLLAAAVDEAGAQIRSLSWSVSPTHTIRHELLAAAASEAEHRAIAYAVALRLRLGAIEEISDVPIMPSPRASGGGDMMMRAAKLADSGPAMNVNAGEIELSASVYVRFATLGEQLGQQ